MPNKKNTLFDLLYVVSVCVCVGGVCVDEERKINTDYGVGVVCKQTHDRTQHFPESLVAVLIAVFVGIPPAVRLFVLRINPPSSFRLDPSTFLPS